MGVRCAGRLFPAALHRGTQLCLGRMLPAHQPALCMGHGKSSPRTPLPQPQLRVGPRGPPCTLQLLHSQCEHSSRDVKASWFREQPGWGGMPVTPLLPWGVLHLLSAELPGSEHWQDAADLAQDMLFSSSLFRH